jgi:hypothetical protein
VLLALVAARRAAALEGCGPEARRVTKLAFEGLEATLPGTVAALLPRATPATYTPLELAELERRLNNLGIFDAVMVGCRGPVLLVRVREKWTLVPNVALSTGETFADTYALLGLTEYNFLGTANQVALSVFRERRGFGASIGFNGHDYQRHGWSLGAELNVSTAAFRFEAGAEEPGADAGPEGEGVTPTSEADADFEPDESWRTTSVTLELSARSPPLADYFNYVAGFYGSSDTVHEVRGLAPPPSTGVLQSFLAFTFDAYEWHDLVPSGVQSSVWFSIGGSFGEERPEPRHNAEWYFRAALPLGSRAVLLGRIESMVGTRGNANYGFVLGSVDGVRGLPDATYYNWAQALGNVELRQSLQLWPRWAMQAVAFADAAAFEQMTAAGGRGDRNGALSVGTGARLVPTWISALILRVDVARLLAPETAWFAQIGLNQYF